MSPIRWVEIETSVALLRECERFRQDSREFVRSELDR